jgi:nucleotide-binding universal stress UspA family protein
MQVYAHILVTMDCSPVDEVIIEHVSALARQNSAKVSLLHVVHSHTLDQDRVLRTQAEQALSAHRDAMQAQGIEVSILIKSGEPEKIILTETESASYDLVAMATHGHGFFGDALFGSVSNTLKHNLRIPLLLLRSER